MSQLSSPKKKIESANLNKGLFDSVVDGLISLPQKKLLLASILLHVFFFTLLFMNWHHQEPVKRIHIPNNIQAQVVNLDDVQFFKDKKAAELEAKKNEKELINRELERQKQLQKQKEQALKKKKEEALKKAAEERKKAEAKKLKLKKEKVEKEKQVKEKKLNEQNEKLKAERLLEEQKKLEEQLERQKKQTLQEQENKLLEKLQKVQQLKTIEEQKAKALAEENERQRKEQAFLDYELSETERFIVLIRSKIENLWRIPPKSEHLRVTLRIRLLPNGELDSVVVTDSSGNPAFDRSATLAVKSVRRYPLPEDIKVFERNFRQFNMTFTPEIL